jgi:group I intron endonuclease
MSTIGIYKITNKINGKAYIGQSINIEKRWKEHKKRYKNVNTRSYDYPLYKAFRKYGIDNFTFEIIEKCKEKKLNEKEIFWIEHYNTFFKGYNQTLGGDHGKSVPKENILGIFEDLENTQLTHGEIAKKRNVSIEMVDGINTGRHWHQNREYPIQKYIPKKNSQTNFCIICNKQINNRNTFCLNCYLEDKAKNIPEKEKLINDLLTYSMLQIGKKYNVSDNAVRRWCKKYELPYKRKDIIEFRNNYNKKGDN